MLPMLQRQPACAQSGEGSGRALPTRSKELILSPQAAPSPQTQQHFPDDLCTYTQSSLFVELQQTSCSSQLMVCSQSYWCVTSVITELLKNTDCNSPFLQLTVRTPQLSFTHIHSGTETASRVWVCLIVLQLNDMENFSCYRVNLRCLAYNLHY